MECAEAPAKVKLFMDLSAENNILEHLPNKTVVIVGGYGSGKSEVAVNLCMHLAAASDDPVAMADLDIVNPYFRSREAAEILADLGIKAVIPPGEQRYSELPIIVPEVRGAIEEHQGWLVLDVGGDDVGARVLSSLADAFEPSKYEMLLVVNANRPFTADADGCLKMINSIESSSRLKFTGLISNTHLMDQTTPDEIERGLKLCREVSARTDLPVVFVCGEATVLKQPELKNIKVPVLPLRRQLTKPWEHRAG